MIPKELEGYTEIGIQPWENIKDGDRFLCLDYVYEFDACADRLFDIVLPLDKSFHVHGAALEELLKHIPVWRKKEEEWVEFESFDEKMRIHKETYKVEGWNIPYQAWATVPNPHIIGDAIKALISAGVLQTKEEGK